MARRRLNLAGMSKPPSWQESFTIQKAVLDLAIPDHVIWFQGFHAYLAFVRCARVADPDDLVSGAPAVPLQGNHLPHLGDALGRNQPHSYQGDLIGATSLRIRGFEISIDFHWNRDMQPLLSANIGYCWGRRCGDFRRETLVRRHTHFSMVVMSPDRQHYLGLFLMAF